ncbi:MAG: MG2 domain-containing protein, partial [Bacteroidota bacterium]
MRLHLTLLLILFFCTCTFGQLSNHGRAPNSRELLYVHTDRTLYAPNETIYFRAYLTDGQRRLHTPLSDVVSLDLLNARGEKVAGVNVFRGERGHAGYLRLPYNLPGGRYTLRAYTNWLGNFGPETFFTKYVYVQKTTRPNLLLELEPRREAYGPGDTIRYDFAARDRFGNPLAGKSIVAELRLDGEVVAAEKWVSSVAGKAVIEFLLPSDLATTDVKLSAVLIADGTRETVLRSVRIVLNDITLAFFPEGGHRAPEGPQKIAFRATDAYGQPADVSGRIMAGDEEVVSFRSTHNGYGHFLLPDGAPAQLRAQIDRPNPLAELYDLPSPRADGFSAQLSVTNQRFQFKTNSQAGEYRLQIATPDSIFWEYTLTNSLDAMLINYPAGVYEATLFDTENKARWKRMFFLRPMTKASTLYPNKTSGKDQEPDTLSFDLLDTYGNIIAGEFSLAIVDDGYHTKQNDKQPHIVTQLLLQSELKGKLYEPNDYFDPEQPQAMAALDDVLLCHGWKGIDWSIEPVYPHLQTGLNGYIEQKNLFTGKLKLDERQLTPLTKNWYCLRLPLYASTTALWPAIRPYTINHAAPLLPIDTLYPATGLKEQQTANRKVPTRTFQAEPVVEQDATVSIRGSRSNASDYYLDGALMSRAVGLSTELDVVMVTGYKKSTKSDATGAASTIYNNTIGAGEYSIHQHERAPDHRRAYFAQRQPKIELQPQWRYGYTGDLEFPQRAYQANEGLLRWLPQLERNEGKATVTYNPPQGSKTYRLILEGITETGDPVHQEATFFTKADFELEAKLPTKAVVGDTLLLDATVRNNLDHPVELSPRLGATKHLRPIFPNFKQQLAAGEARNLQRLVVVEQAGSPNASWRLARKGYGKSSSQSERIDIRPRYFTHTALGLGIGAQESTINFAVNHRRGPITCQLQLFGNPLAAIQEELKELLQAPRGCFEQVVSSAYPNVLTLQLLHTDATDENYFLRLQAERFVKQGNQRLPRFETLGGGFTLWGYGQPRPSLTAYALMHLADLREADQELKPGMIKRSRRFLRAHVDTTAFAPKPDQAYALLALLRHGEPDLVALLDRHQAAALAGEGPAYYRLLMANALLEAGRKEAARTLVQAWLPVAMSVESAAYDAPLSFSHSYGRMRRIEQLGWFITAYLEAIGYDRTLEAVYLRLSELKGQCRYLSTQATVQYLRAVLALIPYRPKSSAGNCEVLLNGEVVSRFSFNKNDVRPRSFTYDAGVMEGQNELRLRFPNTEQPPPFSWRGQWPRKLLANAPGLPLRLSSAPQQREVQRGATVRWDIVVENMGDSTVYSPMVQIGLPGNTDLLAKDLDPL